VVGFGLGLLGCDGELEDAETDSGSGGGESGNASGDDDDSGSASDSASGGDSESSDGGESDVPGNEYCIGVSSWDSAMVEFEEDVLLLVNEVRAAGASCGGQSFGPAGPLTMDPALRCAARVHSRDMAERDFFDHVNPDGQDPFVRMEFAGYSYFTAGENIAAGQASPAMVMQGWMDSPGHCSNIMNASFEDIGVGVFESDGVYRHLWTQTFGAQ